MTAKGDNFFVGGWACLAQCGQVSNIKENRGLPLAGATESSAPTHRLKTSSISGSV